MSAATCGVKESGISLRSSGLLALTCICASWHYNLCANLRLSLRLHSLVGMRMVEYTTYADLRSINSDMMLEERARVVKRAEGRSPAGATFLSHSTKDMELVPAVVRILENHGATVYIDKKDPAVPPYTSRETAKVLRARIREIKKFILFATENSKDSKWMPWELGVADGFKTPGNTAIFPAVETANDIRWTEREYLGVYDRIVWGQLEGYEKPLWMVLDQEKNSASTLRDWLGQ